MEFVNKSSFPLFLSILKGNALSLILCKSFLSESKSFLRILQTLTRNKFVDLTCKEIHLILSLGFTKLLNKSVIKFATKRLSLICTSRRTDISYLSIKLRKRKHLADHTDNITTRGGNRRSRSTRGNGSLRRSGSRRITKHQSGINACLLILAHLSSRRIILKELILLPRASLFSLSSLEASIQLNLFSRKLVSLTLSSSQTLILSNLITKRRSIGYGIK